MSKLVADGLLKSEVHESDGRRAVLKLTAKGRKVYDHILPRFRDRQEQMMAVLSATERAELSRLLNKLVEREDDWARGG